MNFNFTDEQQQLSDAIKRWVQKDYTFEHRRAVVESTDGTDINDWNSLVEFGLLALPMPENAGGFDGTAVDMMVVMQELGRGLVVEPYLPTVLGAEFLKRASGKESIISSVAEGAIKLAIALAERQSRHEMFNVQTTAVQHADGYVLDGIKTIVIGAPFAHKFIVSARTSGNPRDTDGISLFLVDIDTDGVKLNPYKTIDGLRAADITLDKVFVPADASLVEIDHAWALIDEVMDVGASATCAEALGVMEELVQATLEYLNTRKQFGTTLSRFQALQHRAVDMYIELEQARMLTMMAAVKVDSGPADERRRTVSAAKVRVGQALKFIGEQAVHLHGGIGVTDELAVAHYFKRTVILESTFGDSDHHLERFIAQPEFKSAA